MSSRITKKKINSEFGLSVVKCFCGSAILLVPNVKLMSKAVEDHVAKHTQKAKNHKEAEVEAERVRDDLITKILEKASKS